jgi:DUF4097 and DUF4098 domain-containing protein YvlB
MKAPTLVCVLSLLLAPWAIANAATIDEHRAANPQGAVEIDNVAGSIDIQGWDKSEVAVSGTTGKDVERVDVTTDGNRTSIKVVLPQGRNFGMRDGEARLTIRVPTNSSVSTTLVSSDVKVAGVRGSLELRTVSGDISGEGGGDVRANAVSGDIHLTANAAKVIEVKAISGDIVLTGGNANVEATTVSGTVRVTLGSVSRARFKTISGDISASLAANADAQIEGETVSGEVKLEFATAPVADFDLQTMSGDISNCFGPKPTESRHGSGARLAFKNGEGSARVRVATHSGDVQMCTKK